ncbi:DUF625-domain-containing protein [Panus rudis PR-1116 ss-1]|nr:DUF625-domain-containing protein [Panus rudis PR-1116 ss-1]
MDGATALDGTDPANEPMVLINSNEGHENAVTDDSQQWEDDGHELKRVKVYELIGARWVDQGTAFCFGDFHDNEALLIARAENDFQRIILSTSIRANDVYQRQQDTLIVWTEPDGVDYALSFQDPEGCLEVWNFIQEVQRHMNSAADASLMSSPPLPADSAIAANISRTGHLPRPALGNIAEIDRAIKVLSRTQPLKERMVEYIQSEEYIKSLIDVLQQAEDLESLENLHALYSCMQTILSLNDHTMFEHVLEDDIFHGVVGMLEYDPDFPTHKANYRDFLQSMAHFHQPIPIRDESVQRKVHHTYRLQFLKDVVLARSIDDSAFNVLNSCIIFNQIDIITHVQNDPVFLREVVEMFMDDDLRALLPTNPSKGSEGGKAEGVEPLGVGGSDQATHSTAVTPEDEERRKRDVVYLVQQLCVMGKNVQLPARMALFRTLVDRGIIFAVQWAIGQPETEPEGKNMISAAGEILTILLDHDLTGVRGHVVKQLGLIEQDKEAIKKGERRKERETFLMLICRVLVKSRDLAVQSQVGEALRLLMEIQSQEPEQHPVIGAKMFQRPKDDPGQDKFLEYFYKQCAEILFKPFFDLPEFSKVTDDGIILTRERTNLLLHLCDLLSSFTLQHSFRSHFYLLSSHVGIRVASLFKAKDKHVRLAAFRFFRSILRLHNNNLLVHLVKDGLFKPLLELTLQESRRDNLLSSSCQEFFEHIRRENMKDVIAHIMTHEDLVEALSKTRLGGPRFVALKQRHDINMEGPPKEEKSEQQYANGIRRWGQGRLLDTEEEDYFNADDDDDEIVPVSIAFPKSPQLQQNTLKRKRRPSNLPIRQQPPPIARAAPLGSLVDYDDGDEGPDTILEADKNKLSSMSPQPGSPMPQGTRQRSQDRQYQAVSKSVSSPAEETEDAEDSVLEALVAKAGPPSPSLISVKRRREEEEDEEMLEVLARKAKRPSVGPGLGRDKSVKGEAGGGAGAKTGGASAGISKPVEEGGPKKIKLKLSSTTPSSETTSSPSSTGAKDGDTG